MLTQVAQVKNSTRHKVAVTIVQGLYGQAGFSEDALVSLAVERERVLELEERLARYDALYLRESLHRRVLEMEREGVAR